MQTDLRMENNINFENKEITAMHETELFHTKYIVMDKVAHLFGSSSEAFRKVIDNYDLPIEIAERRARVFRGENYLHLPYVVMDFPALFGKEDIFAFRTMFWWGNFFSFTLQLQGSYLERYGENLKSNLHFLKNKDFYFCVNSTPWQYHYNTDNYISLDELLSEKNQQIENQIKERKFLKLNSRIQISEYGKVSEMWVQSFGLLMSAAGVKKR